jgi:hypothetical protein
MEVAFDTSALGEMTSKTVAMVVDRAMASVVPPDLLRGFAHRRLDSLDDPSQLLVELPREFKVPAVGHAGEPLKAEDVWDVKPSA